MLLDDTTRNRRHCSISLVHLCLLPICSLLLFIILSTTIDIVDGQECDEEFSRYLNHDLVGFASPFVTQSTFKVRECMDVCLKNRPSCAAIIFERHAFIRTATCRMFRSTLKTAKGHVHLKPKVPNSFPKFDYFEINSTCVALKESGGLNVEETLKNGGGRGGGLDNNFTTVALWGEWTACSVSCGGGIAIRARYCSRNCQEGEIEKERQPCSLQPCQSDGVELGPNETVIAREVAGEWSAWSDWESCNNPCEGSQNRHRTCYAGSTNCKSGNSTESFSRESERRECKCRDFDFRAISNSFWVGWGRWSRCTPDCGQGEHTRTRQCTVPQACNGIFEQRRPCSSRAECKISKEGPKTNEVVVVREENSGAGTSGGEGLVVNEIDNDNDLNQWTSWNFWSQCSRTCGQGSRIRTRSCPNGNCDGRFTQTEVCNNLDPCPEGTNVVSLEESGGWELWEGWSECTRTCDQGTRSRKRACAPGRSCFGSADDIEICGFAVCPEEPLEVFSQWNGWGQWSDCSKSCGEGVRTRDRSCNGNNCIGDTADVRICAPDPCPTWTSWQSWTPCSRTCDNGSRFRNRTCTGNFCEGGQGTEVDICGPSPCPTQVNPIWQTWEQWSACSRTCDNGTRSRNRTCSLQGFCQGSNIDIEICSQQTCPPSPAFSSVWSVWSQWSDCTATCGDALRQRSRICDGTLCPGASEERQICNQPDCPTDSLIGRESDTGNWASWGEWALCSATCGPGIKARSRSCPSRRCVGESVSGVPCNEGPCTLDPPETNDFGKWTAWSRCSTSCGSATRRRSRFCRVRGNCQKELDSQEAVCRNQPECPNTTNSSSSAGSSGSEGLGVRVTVGQKWSSWSDWSDCNVSCGSGGRRRRMRGCEGPSCTNPNQTEEAVCEQVPCPNTTSLLGWSRWTSWTACSETCGQGIRVRDRVCTTAEECPGKAFESEFCSEDCSGGIDISSPNEVFGQWTPWNEWSECFRTFGSTAEKIRIRICPNGQKCQGTSFDTMACRAGEVFQDS